MKNLQDATAQICSLKAGVLVLNTVVNALLPLLPPDVLRVFEATLSVELEAARNAMLHLPISEQTRDAFERDARLLLCRVDQLKGP